VAFNNASICHIGQLCIDDELPILFVHHAIHIWRERPKVTALLVLDRNPYTAARAITFSTEISDNCRINPSDK
jgi:hypothetical protein